MQTFQSHAVTSHLLIKQLWHYIAALILTTVQIISLEKSYKYIACCKFLFTFEVLMESSITSALNGNHHKMTYT